MDAVGSQARHVIACRRAWEGRELLVVAPRLTAGLNFPPTGEVWQDTSLAGASGRPYRIF